MSALYAKLTEHCDWEGETWYFFVRYQGNERALQTIAELIDDAGPYFEAFELDLEDLVPEHEVAVLVKHSPSGYMNLFNRIDGRIELPPLPEFGDISPDVDEERAAEWLTDHLYKGGIEKWVVR